MMPTAAECTKYLGWLTAAEDALHELMVNKRATTVRYGEKEVQYQPADSGKLQAYIEYLRKRSMGCPGCARQRRHVIHVVPQ